MHAIIGKIKARPWKTLVFSLVGAFGALVISGFIANASGVRSPTYSHTVTSTYAANPAVYLQPANQNPVYITPSPYSNNYSPVNYYPTGNYVPQSYYPPSNTGGSAYAYSPPSAPTPSQFFATGCNWTPQSMYAWVGSGWLPVGCATNYNRSTGNATYMEASPIFDCNALWGPNLNPAQPTGWYVASGSTIRPLMPTDCRGLPVSSTTYQNTYMPTAQAPPAPVYPVPVTNPAFVVPNTGAGNNVVCTIPQNKR